MTITNQHMARVYMAEARRRHQNPARRDCSTLPFDKMPVIERAPGAVIVRCTQHKRRAIVRAAAAIGEKTP